MSMLPPHLEAATLLAVMFDVYPEQADVTELLAERDDIMPETDIGELAALGGFMMPNIPCWQWPGVPQWKNTGFVSLTT